MNHNPVGGFFFPHPEEPGLALVGDRGGVPVEGRREHPHPVAGALQAVAQHGVRGSRSVGTAVLDTGSWQAWKQLE